MTRIATATRIVVATGPEAGFNRFRCEEVPVWTVAIEDWSGNPTGRIWTCSTRAIAQRLMANIARDRRIPAHDETTAA